MDQKSAEQHALAIALAAHRDCTDIDWVEGVWDEYGPAREKALSDAGDFIAMHDALTAIRADAAEQPDPRLALVDILAKHQPRYLEIGVMLDNKPVNAMPCAAEGCDFLAHVPDGANGRVSKLRHQFAAHQAKMIRQGAK